MWANYYTDGRSRRTQTDEAHTDLQAPQALGDDIPETSAADGRTHTDLQAPQAPGEDIPETIFQWGHDGLGYAGITRRQPSTI